MDLKKSPPSDSSDMSGSPPKLDPNTLALLDSFFAEKAEEERLFKEIAAERAAAQIAGLALELDSPPVEKPMSILVSTQAPVTLVDKFGRGLGFLPKRSSTLFMAQGYPEYVANNLAEHLHALCTPSTNIAFLCCPTAFVAFQHMKRLDGAVLMEYDQRFAVLSPTQFVPYDLDEPDDLPQSLKGKIDVAVVDPPFLNEVTNTKVKRTLLQILQPKGKLLLITSTSIEDILQSVYNSPPLGPLRRTALEVEHGRLANDFACWGSWDGVENFGKINVNYE